MTNKSTLAQRLSHAWPWTKPIGSSPTTSRLLRYSLLCMLVLLCGGSAWADDATLAVDFEEETTSYTDWTFTNFATKQTNSGVAAHGGSYFGSTGGKTSGSLVTKEKLAKPKNIQFYISKTSTNSTASSWIIKVSTDGEEWTDVKTQSASAGITKGTWTEVTQDLTSYTNVYVGIFYDGTTAIRTIDDVTLTYENVNDTRTATTIALADGYATTGVEGKTVALPTVTVMAGENTVTGAEVTWKSSDESVAKIEGNKISLLTPGTATITATYAGDDSYKSSKATYDLTVTELSVEGLALMAIIFKDSGSGNDSSTKITSIDDIISEGKNYVSEIPTPTNVYNGQTGRGLKLGANNKSATLKLTLAKAVKPIKITFDAMQYSDTETSITVNGKTITNLGSELATYSIVYDGNTEVSEITISTPAERAYITNVKIYYEPEATPAPLYIFGVEDLDEDNNTWSLPADMKEMTWNAENEAYEYTLNNTSTAYFCFSQTNEITENDWETFNSTYRWAYSEGGFTPEIDTETQLNKVTGGNDNIVLPAGEWTISVTQDMIMTITGEATPVTPTEDTYVVAGAIKVGEGDEEKGFFGAKWDGTAGANKMVEQNGTYSITYNDVEFTANTTILYQIVKNGNEWIPENNKWYGITAGTYDITFTYDPNATEGDGISFNATLKINSVFAAGNGSEGWLNNKTWASDAETNEMVEVTDGIWEITYENVPQSNDLEVKFTLNGTWDNNFGNATTENFTAFGEATAATYNGKNIVFETDGVKNIKLQLDLTEFDYTTRLGAKFTITLEDVEEPAGDVTATWDFRGETPTPATLTKVNVESKATYYPSNNAIAALYVNALNGKLAYNSSGYAQFNDGTILRVPVYTTDDVVTVTAYPGQYKYTIGGSAATADETVHTATAEEVSKGYVEIVATGGAYLYAITMKTTQTAAKHAVWNFLNEIPTTITGTEINSTTGSVASSVEGIALDVNGYLKARGTDGWIKTNTTMNVPVKTEGDIVTVMAYSTQYDNYTVGGKDASNNESPIYTYKATTTDATNGYVTIATSDQQAYIYAISVQQLPVKEPTTLDNEEVTATFPFNLGTEGQTATFSDGDANYFLNSKVAWGSNFTVNGTCTVSGITETQLKATAKEKEAAESNLIKFTFTPKPGFTFTPTKVTFTATRVGTNGGILDVAWYNSNKTASLETGFTPNRDNDATQPYSTKIYDLTTATGIVAGEGECGLQFNLYNLDGGKNYGFANIIIEGTLSGTEQEVPILASFKVNGTEYSVEELFGDEYEATLKLSKSETMVGTNNPLTEITAASGEVGTVTYDDSETACTVTIPVTAGNTTLDYVLNVIQKPDYMLTYYGVDGTTILDTETREEGMTIGQFLIDIANVQAKTDGYKARGWFKNNYVGEKWTTESVITADAKLYAVETEIEVSSDSKKYVFDLTDKNFDAADHEAFNPTGNGKWHDNQHGWVFKNGDQIDLLVGGKASIILGLCKFSDDVEISASNGKSVDAYNENDGATATIEYEGNPGTLTLNFNGTTYLHKLTIFNTTTTNYEVNGDWIIVKEGDASSLVDAIEAAKEGARIFLPNGTYDLGQKTLTTVGSNNVSIIGESMEGVIIKNRPVKEGIAITATLLNKGTNLYMQDLTLDCIAPYGTGDDTKSAERGVTLQDQGDQTILKNVYLKGLQDTYYSNNPSGTYYFEDGKVEGSVDYVCGNGDVYFNKTLFYTVNKSTGTKGGCIAAPNTRKDFGYIFNECTLDGVANEDGQYRLGRPWAADTKCFFVNTTMIIQPNAAGWGEWGTPNAVNRFAEYNSVDANSEAIDLNSRATTIGGQPNNPVLTEAEATALAPNVIFSGEWKPQVIAQQVAAPKAQLSKDGKKIEWTPANNGATAYAIFKDGKFLGITTGSEWTIEEVAGAPALHRAEEPEKTGYTIRAANSRGGFGPAADVSPATSIAAIEAELGGDVKIYDLNGRRVMTPTKGVYIINGKKVVIK